ncbi:hypothetical protein ANN_00700 [Periplaneta americana]|uniref:Uncharacterized protein n=1 Tax=Periplaneta americana TaxID=6978 RepID=A0ABQ8TTA6_PERAM|nr:hypothetical protein ANN_00700 [Periplaneta americana]
MINRDHRLDAGAGGSRGAPSAAAVAKIKEERKLNSKVKQAQGFLQEEDAGEDWLENDVVTKGRPIKRRCLERNRRFVGEDVNNEDVDIEEVMTPEEEHRSGTPVRSVTPQPAKPIESAVRVRVDSRLLLVPVQTPEQQSIGWLAQEAARRYYSFMSLDIITSIKIARLRWAGHVKRMDECEIPRKVMEYGIAGGRRVGRPKLRWMDCVMDDIKRLGVKNWWTVAKDRD